MTLFTCLTVDLSMVQIRQALSVRCTGIDKFDMGQTNFIRL